MECGKGERKLVKESIEKEGVYNSPLKRGGRGCVKSMFLLVDMADEHVSLNSCRVKKIHLCFPLKRQAECGNRREAPAVNGAGSVFFEHLHMHPGCITLMFLETIDRIKGVKMIHQPVPGNFCNY